MGRAAAFLLLAGCAGRDPAADLDVRLLAQGPFALGTPMRLALEVTNRGSLELCFDVQELGHQPYAVRTSGGRDVPYVDPRVGGIGTVQDFVSLKPGETVRLDEIDLADQFAILDPGDYAATFNGLEAWGRGEPGWTHGGPAGAFLTRVPASAPLRFTVGAGPLSPRDQILRALLPALPKGWILYKTGPDLACRKAGFVATLSLSPMKDATSLGRGLWISPLQWSSKSDRTSKDPVDDSELRAAIEKALR